MGYSRLKGKLIYRYHKWKYGGLYYEPLPTRQNRDRNLKVKAFLRVKNEIDTLPACLKSILPVLQGGVIGYNECTDGTAEYIEQFCQENSSYTPYHYDRHVEPAFSLKYKDDSDFAERYGLHTYYNMVLSQLDDGDWFMKVDADHVYDTKRLAHFLSIPKDDYDCVYISRMNLHYDGKQLWIHKKSPFYLGEDHWLIRKTSDLKFKLVMGGTNESDFYAVEHLRIGTRRLIHTDLFNWHFPYHKKSRIGLTRQSDWLPIGRAHEVLDKNFLARIPDEMLNEDYILEHLCGLPGQPFMYE